MHCFIRYLLDKLIVDEEIWILDVFIRNIIKYQLRYKTLSDLFFFKHKDFNMNIKSCDILTSLKYKFLTFSCY